jgi:hypothetical protein
MAGVFGSTQRNSTAAEMLSDMSVQTSGYGRCIPVVYGRARVAANLVYYDDFDAIPHTEVQRTGKGGGGTRDYDTTYTYTATVILAICEGPVQGVGTVWVDKEVYGGPAEAGASPGSGVLIDHVFVPWTFTVMPGSPAQAEWGHVKTKHPDKAAAYGSTCYAAHSRMDLGASGALKNHSFDVLGFHGGYIANGDANPADVLLDMLTDPVHGMGLPAAAIAPLADYGLYAAWSALTVSAAFETQGAGLDAVRSLLECTNSMPVWSGGKLKILPLGDLPVGEWNPNSTPLYALSCDDFLMDGADGDPVEITRKPASDAYNSVKVKYKDRNADYNKAVAAADDLAMQDQHGLRPASDFDAAWIKRPAAAQTLAQILLQRHVGIRNEYRFRLGWRYTLLEPGDLVTLTEPGLGLDGTPVRITAVEEDGEGCLTITAEDWPNGVATAVAYPPPPSGGGRVNAAAKPGDCAPPIIFEPPADLTGGRLQVMVGTSGGPEWGGCEIHASRDGTTYAPVGRITAPARHGALYGDMAAWADANPQTGTGTTRTCRADMAASGGELISATDADAAGMATLSYVSAPGGGYELFSYRTAELVSASRYRLQTLYRGLYSTAAAAHPAGSRFMRLDHAVAAIDLPRWNVGETVFLKFPSFNRRGLALQSLADVAAVAYTITGAGIGAGAWAAPSVVTIAITRAAPLRPGQGGAVIGGGGGEGWHQT